MRNIHTPTFVSGAEVLARVGMPAAIDAVEAAFAARNAGAIGVPVSVGIAVAQGSFHVKACAAHAAGGSGLFVAKVNSNFPGNRSCDGLPTIQGVVAVFETGSGRLRALIDSPSVTALRTAATTAVALRHLAPDGARGATVVGCGALGRFHLQALAACGFGQVSVFDRVAARAEDAARWARSELGLDYTAVAQMRPATLASAVVITCTTATEPFLGREDVRAGTFVAAVGADSERKAEVAPALLAEARVVADSIEQCLKMGDLRNAAHADARACGELADAVAGRLARTSAGEVVVFDSTGLALEDLAICALLV